MNSTISLIINTYNRAEYLERTLESLKYLRHELFEVVVVVGPCSDRTEDVVSCYRDSIKTIRCEEANLSKSRNLGIMAASGEIVAFIDDDGIPEPDWLNRLEECYTGQPSVGAAGGFVRDHTGFDFQSKYILCDFDGNAKFHDEKPKNLFYRPQDGVFPTLIGVNSSFRRSALLEVGGFDEEYSYFLDETDLCLRLMEAGWQVVFNPLAEVHHKYAPSEIRSVKNVPSSLHAICRSKVYFQFRHHKATDQSPFFRSLETKHQLYRDVERYHALGLIDETHRLALMEDINIGYSEGVRDAHTFTLGRARSDIGDEEAPAFLRFAKAHPPERKKLILVSQEFPPFPCGGVGNFIFDLARTLAEKGHEIAVISRSNGGHTVDFESGIWVHRIPHQNHLKYDSLDMPDLPAGIRDWAISVYEEARRIQSIRGHSTVLAAVWDLESAALAASPFFSTITYLVTTYALSLPTKPEWTENEHFLTEHVQKMISGERWLLEHSDLVVSSTRSILADVNACYDENIEFKADVSVIPFGIPDLEISSANTQDAQNVRILFVGRFELRKGVDLLFELMPNVLKKFDSAEFRLVGNSNIEVDGEKLIDVFNDKHAGSDFMDRIHVLGEVDRDQLIREYSECDIFVAPSRYESFGLIYLEAMRAGKPIVACSTGGVPEIVTGECGILVPPGDSHQLSNAIEHLLSDAATRLEMGREGRKRFERSFQVSRFADQVELLLSSDADLR